MGLCPGNHALRTPRPIEEKIVHLRLTYHFGPTRIAWYLGRYHGFSISTHGVYNVLVRNGINRLSTSFHKRSMPSKRSQKQVPGHHIQVDVKFLHLENPEGRKVRRFQYTAIDDATRIRALKAYEKHTQSNAIDFIDQVVERCPLPHPHRQDGQRPRVRGRSPTGTSRTRGCATSTSSRGART